MRLSRLVRPLCVATALVLASLQVQAQGKPPAAVQAPLVPDQVAEAYRWADFDELERLYALYGKAGVRSEQTGTERVKHFWMGIHRTNGSDLPVSDDFYLQMDRLTGRWAADHPQSVLAQLLYAEALRTHAWAYRGSGYADTVSPAAFAGFRKYLELALAQLRRAETLAATDSSWNDIMLDVGLGLGWDRRDLLAVFEKGIAKNPDHDELYFSMQRTLLPKWGGDLESVDRFITLAVKKTQATRGLEMYARLYASVSYAQVHQDLFTSTRASWVSMKAGFEDRLKRYPHTDHHNMYAYFACMANDRQALREQLERIGDKFEAVFWGDNPQRSYEMCKNLAQQI